LYDWIDKGARPSDSVDQIMRTAGFWERYERHKQGEPDETLVAEAKEAETTRNTSVKTRRDTPQKKSKKTESS
jgi:small subunit ribosomal protein S16